MSCLAPAAPEPFTTGVPVDDVFDFGGILRSPGFFTFFALDVWLSPDLLVAPSASDFMADAAPQEEEPAYSDTLWVL